MVVKSGSGPFGPDPQAWGSDVPCRPPKLPGRPWPGGANLGNPARTRGAGFLLCFERCLNARARAHPCASAISSRCRLPSRPSARRSMSSIQRVRSNRIQTLSGPAASSTSATSPALRTTRVERRAVELTHRLRINRLRLPLRAVHQFEMVVDAQDRHLVAEAICLEQLIRNAHTTG